MRCLRSGLIVLLALALAGTASTRVLAQSATPGAANPAMPGTQPTPPRTPVLPDTTPYPVDVDRVKDAAQRQPGVNFDEQHVRFYVLILAREQEDFVAKFAKDYDFRNGPTRRGAAMTNQEFLNMVTPKELNELFGSTSASSFAMFQAAVMNAAGQALIKKALKDIHDARNDREVAAIRERIDRELAALLGK